MSKELKDPIASFTTWRVKLGEFASRLAQLLLPIIIFLFISAVTIMVWNPSNYHLAHFADLAWSYLIVLVVVYLFCSCRWQEKLQSMDEAGGFLPQTLAYRLAAGLTIVLLAYNLNVCLTPISQAKQTDHFTPQVCYLTYSSHCKFCRAAEPGVRRAVATYNHNHWFKPVVLVNLDRRTPLVKEIKRHIRYQSSIVYQSSATKTNVRLYTLANRQGQPVRVSPQHVYQQLLNVQKIKK